MASLGIQWEMVEVSFQKSNDTCHLVTLETLISNRAKVRKTHLNTSCRLGKKESSQEMYWLVPEGFFLMDDLQ